MLTQTKSTCKEMHTEFSSQFMVGKQFESIEEIKKAFMYFRQAYNVAFSVKDSHPTVGRYYYVCKHGGIKRDVSHRTNAIPADDAETIDLTKANNSTKKTAPLPKKEEYRKNTQKLNCPAFVRFYNLRVTSREMLHNHPLPKDTTVYAVNRKHSPMVTTSI